MEYHPIANIFPLLQGEEFEALKQDIKQNGLLEPIWLHPDGRIIDGRNRHRACTEIGINPKTKTYKGDLSANALVSFVISLNLHRRHLTSSQLAVVALEVEKVLAQEAKERQGQRTDIPDIKEIFPESSKGQARDQAAAIVGTNGRYVQDAKKLEEKAPDLLEQVATGEISLPQAKKEYKKRTKAISQVKEVEKIDGCKVIFGDAQKIDLSQFEQYSVIIADPPWPYRVQNMNGTANNQYDVMTDEDLRAMPVSQLAKSDCVLFLWGTWPKLPEAIQLIQAWGFEYVTGFPWIKTTSNGSPDYGVGYWIRGASEYILIARKGNVSAEPLKQKGYLGLMGPNLNHSRKPDSVHQMAEEFEGPYLELFARRPRHGWTVFGNDKELFQQTLA